MGNLIQGGPYLKKLRQNVWEASIPNFELIYNRQRGQITRMVNTHFVPEKELDDYLNKLECDTYLNGKDIVYFKYKKWEKTEKVFGKILVEDNFKSTPKGYLVRYCLIDRDLDDNYGV